MRFRKFRRSLDASIFPVSLIVLPFCAAASVVSQATPAAPSGAGLVRQSSPTSASSPAAMNMSAAPADDLANFGDTIQILGAMERTDQDFVDGFALDLFSPKNHSIVITQNNTPLSGGFVKGSTGEPFVALSNYSYVLKMNETANDLVAKVELPYDPDMLQQMDIATANLYVGTLSEDKKAWIVSESQRNVHVSENKTRIIKMTSLDGEYILLGRKTEDSSNIFVQYGQGDTRTVNITGGPGIQESEFVDGLRFSIESNAAVKLNADFENGIDASSLPAGFRALNSFSWVVNTTQQGSGNYMATLQFPVNRRMLQTMVPGASSLSMVSICRRDVNASSSPYTPLSNVQRGIDSITASGVSQLDGAYAMLISSVSNETSPLMTSKATSGAIKLFPRLTMLLVTVIVSVLSYWV